MIWLRLKFCTAILLAHWSFLPHDRGQVARAAPEQTGRPEPGRPKAKPAREPDYTRLSGAVDDAQLPAEEPEVLWRYVSEAVKQPDGTIRMAGLSDAVVGGGVVYFGDDRGRLQARNIEDGSDVWIHEHGSRIAVQPSIDRDHVYFTSSQFGITALSRDTGEIAWRHAIDHGADVTPIPVGERVYAAGYDGVVYAFDQKTGDVVWEHDFATDAPADQPNFQGQRARFGQIVARPYGAACDGKLLVQCVMDQSRVIALDCATGKRRWTFQAAGWMSSTPTIVGDRVYATSQDAHLYCLELATGALAWKTRMTGWFQPGVAVHAGKVYLPYHRGKLFQIAADSGRVLHEFQSDDAADRESLHGGAPLVANGIVYFTTSAGNLLAVDADSLEFRWALHPSEGSELPGNIATDGRRIIVTARQDIKEGGECALIVIGRSR